MPDTEQNKQSDFMIERIKERPINKKKLLRRTLITVILAVIFGLIACLTFLILEPVFSNWLHPEEEPQIVVLPEVVDEVAPEDMLVEDEAESVSIQEALESALLEGEQIQMILDSYQFDREDYMQMYASIAEFCREMNRSMVTVTGVASGVDWMNDIHESKGQTYGVIVTDNGKEYLILTDLAVIRDAESISVTFADGESASATVKQKDEQTKLAVLAVPMSEVSEETSEELRTVVLGASNAREMVGMPVVALGCPLGTVGSAGYGMIVAPGYTVCKRDANYKLFTTDIFGSADGTGALFNMQGQLIGIVTTERVNADRKNMVTAIGVSELRKLIENMCNGRETAYLGISGMDVTPEANEQMQVPFGAYVSEVEIDSPAMIAGIQRGDVIVRIGDSVIESFSNYTSELRILNPGTTVKVMVRRPVQDEYKDIEMEATLGTAK